VLLVALIAVFALIASEPRLRSRLRNESAGSLAPAARAPIAVPPAPPASPPVSGTPGAPSSSVPR